MARTGWSTSNFLRYDSAIVTTYPFTLAAWCLSTGGGSRHILGLYNSASTGDTNYCSMLMTTGDAISARSCDGTSASNATSSASATDGVWCHAAAIFVSTTSRASYLDGANKGTNATSRAPSGFNRTSISHRDNSSNDQAFNATGLLAEAAIWNVALSDAEVAMLGAARVSPLLVRRDALVAYWPLLGGYSPEIDLIGRQDMTIQGSLSTVPHAPVLRPMRRRPGRLVYVAPPPLLPLPRLALLGAGA
jgi:Concanavalin A-like lectin/glucanases superfamily